MRRIQISTTVLVTSIASALVIGFFISPPEVTPAAAAVQTTSSPGKASNTTPTLGNPAIIYTESDKSSVPFPSVSINGPDASIKKVPSNSTDKNADVHQFLQET